MAHIDNLNNAHLDRASVVTIGMFDGVHRGHQYLVRRLSEEAHSSGKLAVALTFFPHPDVVLRGITGRYYLTTREQRADLLMRMGIDHVITQVFDDAVRHIRAADFVDQLIEHLRLDSLWLGENFAMGYKREGNIDFLTAQGREKGFSVQVVDMMQTVNHGEVISSTAIRDLLGAGDVRGARQMLGRSYAVSGEVVAGEKRGRKIGFPTANIDVWDKLLVPANGVYAGWATLDGERFPAVTNVGVRPTFEGTGVTVEAHLLDFDRDIYGRQLEFSFEERLRAEQKFDGIDALIAQIRADVEAARAFLVQRD